MVRIYLSDSILSDSIIALNIRMLPVSVSREAIQADEADNKVWLQGILNYFIMLDPDKVTYTLSTRIFLGQASSS